jgi:hypothetical protein
MKYDIEDFLTKSLTENKSKLTELKGYVRDLTVKGLQIPSDLKSAIVNLHDKVTETESAIKYNRLNDINEIIRAEKQ